MVHHYQAHFAHSGSFVDSHFCDSYPFFSLKAFRQAFGTFWRAFKTKIFGLKSPKLAPQLTASDKEDAEQRLHSRLASFLIFGSTFLFYTLIILTVVQTVFHVRYIVTHGVSSLMSGEQFPGVKNFTTEYSETAASWFDAQVNERFPTANFSASKILKLANEMNEDSVDPFTLFCQQAVVTLKNYNLLVTSAFVETSFLGLNSSFSYGEIFHEWKSVFQLAWDNFCANPNAEKIKATLANVFSSFSSAGSRVFSVLLSGAGFISHCAVIASVAHTFVARKSSVLEDFSEVLEASIDSNGIFQKSIEASLNAIFAKMVKTFVWHSMFTWLSFEVLGVPFSLLAGLMSGIISILPIASSFSMIVVPFGIFFLGVAERSIIRTVMLIGVHYFYSDCIHPLIYQDVLIASGPSAQVLPSEKITGTSIALGVIAFGAKGIVFGPLLACAPGIILAMYRSMLMLEKEKS